MTDDRSPERRSYNMSRIKGAGNDTTELRFARILRKHKLNGWRRHAEDLPGKPDFVFRDFRVAVFVDGCFWHGCKLCSRLPSTNRGYWSQKILRNMSRDRRVAAKLRRGGWKVLRIWEHSLNNPDAVIKRLRRSLRATGEGINGR